MSFSFVTRDLISAVNFRKKILSNVVVYGLQRDKTISNNTCMNDFLLNQIITQTMIYSTPEQVGQDVLCTITSNGISWSFPPDTGLDSDFECKIPMLDGQIVVLNLKIVAGTMSEDARFCFVNSVGLTENDGIFTLLCETQRNSTTRQSVLDMYLDFL